MKKSIQKAVVGSALVFCAPVWAQEGQVDYSKCQEFLTPSQQNGGFNMRPSGYLPFDINDDGSIKPHQDIVSYEQDKDGGAEVITYKVPNYIAGVYSAPAPGTGGFYGPGSSQENVSGRNPYTANLRKIKVRIERDDQGQLTKIITDNDFSAGELSRMQKQNTEAYMNSLTEQQRENLQNFSGDEEFQVPMHQRAGSEISLEIKNGQCVPIEQDERFLVEAKPDGESLERTVYNTELCHDIDDFLNEHPETAACFNPDLNQKMSDIFKKYYEPPKTFPGFGGGIGGAPMGGGFGMGGPGIGMGAYASPDLNSEIMPYAQRYANNEEQQDFLQQMDRSTGRSPVIGSHSILQRCYNMGLGSFIDDPTIWQAAGVAPSSAKNEEQSSATTR